MSVKLYVGGVPYTTTEASLRAYFERFGQVVSVSIVIDRMTGRSKGFGFVELSTNDEASAAIDAANGVDFEGRKLTVNVARPLEPRAPRMRGAGRGMDRRPGFEVTDGRQEVQETSQSWRLRIAVALPDDADVEYVALGILELCSLLNRLHIADGGPGLVIDEWEMIERAPELVGIES